jgi:hypothetical protein
LWRVSDAEILATAGLDAYVVSIPGNICASQFITYVR